MTAILIERLPTTIELAVYSLLFASVVGVLLGLISALRRNSRTDVTTMFGAILGVSIPIFVLALLLQFVFAVALPTFTGISLACASGCRRRAACRPAWSTRPSRRPGASRTCRACREPCWTSCPASTPSASSITFQWTQLVDACQHLILPVIALGTISLAIIARITRSSLLEVLGLDYIRTARAKGVADRSVLRKHAFRNAMLPVVTIIGLQLGLLLAGAVLTETVFNLTGVGRTMYDAIVGRDYIVVQAMTLIIAIIYLTREPGRGHLLCLPRPTHPTAMRDSR